MEKVLNENKEEVIYFKPNYKQGKFQTIFDNIKKFFSSNGNYLSFIKEVKDPFFKEILTLMRKYQDSFHKFYLNDELIIDTVENKGLEIPSGDDYNLYINSFISSKLNLTSESDDIIKKENDKNKFTFMLSIVPKNTKQEVNVLHANDNFELVISFSILIDENLNNKFIEKDTNINFINQQIKRVRNN